MTSFELWCDELCQDLKRFFNRIAAVDYDTRQRLANRDRGSMAVNIPVQQPVTEQPAVVLSVAGRGRSQTRQEIGSDSTPLLCLHNNRGFPSVATCWCGWELLFEVQQR